jgi:hypothetical protein
MTHPAEHKPHSMAMQIAQPLFECCPKWQIVICRRVAPILHFAFFILQFAFSPAFATPPGFVKTTIPLDGPPAGLAFDSSGVLYALEGAPFGSNQATLHTILADGSFGASFTVAGDDSSNFFVGAMAYDPVGDRLLITDNTADGRLYAVDKAGSKQTLSQGVAGAAGIAVRDTGEIFLSTSPFGSAGDVFLVDRASGATTSVLAGLGFGAGLAFDSGDNLIVQDADSTTFQGRLQQLPISGSPGSLSFGSPVPLLGGMQSSAGVVVDNEGDLFTTGNGGLFAVAGSPLAESSFDSNGSVSQFATAIAFDAGTHPFAPFAGPGGGRVAYMADFGFSSQDDFITLLTPAQPGDYNGNGFVEASDLAVWRSAFGSATDLSADGNLNGVVDASDYVIWRKNVTSPGAGSTAMVANVPEPASWALLLTFVTIGPGLRGLGRTARGQEQFRHSLARQTAQSLGSGSRIAHRSDLV